ncbi:MAG: hypothetical protein COA83_03525, partial [Methylophaga sp.]
SPLFANALYYENAQRRCLLATNRLRFALLSISEGKCHSGGEEPLVSLNYICFYQSILELLQFAAFPALIKQ